jgi:hypothetical protein
MATFQYRDKWLRVIVYPVLAIVIRHFGEMGSLGYLLKTRLYYLDVLWNMLIVACSWEANRAIIMYLDGKYSWSANKFQRFVLQFFIGLPLTFFIVIPMIYLWNEVLTEHHGFDTANLLVNDVPLVIIFTGIMHLVYTGMYHKQLYEAEINRLNNRILELENSVINTAGAQSTTNTGNYREVVVANHGISSVPLHVKDMSCFSW